MVYSIQWFKSAFLKLYSQSTRLLFSMRTTLISNTIGISMLLLVGARTKIVRFRMLRTFLFPSIDGSGMKDLGGPILVNGVECRHLSGPLCNSYRFSSGIPVRTMDWSNVKIGIPPAFYFHPLFCVTCYPANILTDALYPSLLKRAQASARPTF